MYLISTKWILLPGTSIAEDRDAFSKPSDGFSGTSVTTSIDSKLFSGIADSPSAK